MSGSQQRSHEKGSPPDATRGVYSISVVAELTGIGAQTLRLYEQHGLLAPARSAGGTRRYSGDDLARVRRIGRLVEQGVNLAAIGRILELEDANSELHADNRRLEADNQRLRREN
ncbi:MerR family transcriptional regulator [Nocardia inohanensis]|uniref:MerR family transcriptional regulator n=1 Tax=Nocardia inohanensis TaxID=209246 RepID=UPI00082E1DCD|nr:MerR family transcriptional regulator [Nocardia inohanensis]